MDKNIDNYNYPIKNLPIARSRPSIHKTNKSSIRNTKNIYPDLKQMENDETDTDNLENESDLLGLEEIKQFKQQNNLGIKQNIIQKQRKCHIFEWLNKNKILIIILLICCFISRYYACSEDHKDFIYNIKEKIYNLKEDFPLQSDDTWIELESALTKFFQHPNSISIIFSYEDDINTSRCLIKNLLQSFNLTQINVKRTYKKGELITSLKNKPYSGLIIENLQDFPIEMLQDFHFLCDPDTNMNNKYMCMSILKTKKNNGEKTFKYINRLLTKLWSDKYGTEETAALVTRLNTNNVNMQNENKLPANCDQI